MEESSKEKSPKPAREVNLKDMKLVSLPKSLSQLPAEEILHLDVRENNLRDLDMSVLIPFTNLRYIDMRYNNIELLDDTFSCLCDLKVLRVDNNQLSSLPLSIFTLKQLQVLTISKNSICFIPRVINQLQCLSTLIVSDNQLKILPSELGELRKIKTLFIHGNHYSEIPVSLRKLSRLQEFSLEWFRYTVPMLPRFLKGQMGETIISSIKELLESQAAKGKDFCDVGDFLKHFSEKSFKLSRRDLRQRSLLHVAAAHGDCGVVQGLLNRGVNPNSIDSEGLSPLVVSLQSDNFHVANLLIDSDADVNCGGSHSGSALHMAVAKSETWVTRNLLKKGADPHARDCEGNTPFHILCGTFSCKKKKNTLIAEMLLQAGGKVDALNIEGWTPLHIAARRGQTAAISWLAKLTDIDVQNTKDKDTPLHLATCSGHLKSILNLIENGADATIENAEGKTPKEFAKADLAVYKLLSKTEKQMARERKICSIPNWKNQPCKDFTLDIAQPLYLRYQGLYDIFKGGNCHDMNFAVLEMENCNLKADAVHMMSYMKNKHARKMLEHVTREDCQSEVVHREAKYALRRLRTNEVNATATSLIGPKLYSKPMQIPTNVSYFLEEDTGFDSLSTNVLP